MLLSPPTLAPAWPRAVLGQTGLTARLRLATLAASASLALALSLTHDFARAQGAAAAQATTATTAAPSAPAAEASWPAPTPALIRPHQVWLDALPDSLAAADLEVVLLSPDSRCKPPVQKGLFGLSVPTLHPVTAALCRRIEGFVAAPPTPLPLTTRVATQLPETRQPQALLAALTPAPTRRYVALVHWQWSQTQRDLAWQFEVLVIDRQDGRRVWHGARVHEVWPAPEWQARTELRALQALLQHELPRDLLRRGWWRDEVPVAGSRWVPAEEIARYRPAADRAGLAVVNSYTSGQRLQDVAVLKLWPAGTQEVDDTERLRQGDGSQASTVRRAQASPVLGADTHALLDLPPGDYAVRVYTTVETMTLAPGQIAVLDIQRGLGNAKLRVMATEAWWRDEVLARRGRHAFFAEPPERGRPPVVPYFLDRTP